MKKYSMLLFSLLSTVVTAIIIAFIPKEILPTHYGINGQADTTSSKWVLMILPCILLTLSLVLIVANHFISYSENAEKNQRYIQLVFKGLYAFLFVLFWILLLISINNIQNIGSFMPTILCIAMGLLITFISNYFGKIKQNSVLGIRINATLSSEIVWQKTHRLGGLLGVISGLIMIILGIISIFINQLAIMLSCIGFAIIIILLCIVPIIYAEVIYSKEKKQFNRE